MISLAGGASLGPEQALASIGGGLATYVTDNYVTFADEQYSKLVVLGGMASALGALFPTPLLGVLMLIELSNLPKTYMESTLVMSCGACISFLVYYSMVDISLIESISSKGGVFSLYWKFSETNCLTAFSIGVICAALVVPSVLAGLALGLIYWALPLTIGNGSMVITSIISYGKQNKLSKSLLVSSLFAKMFTLGISMNGGFVGGFIFPIITIATMAAVLSHLLYPDIPLGLFLGCFMAGLPAAICPMPFTLSGLFGAMQRRGQAADRNMNNNNNENAPIEPVNNNERKKEKEIEDNFAFEQYMGSKRLQSAL
eukprot:gene17930-23552_t